MHALDLKYLHSLFDFCHIFRPDGFLRLHFLNQPAQQGLVKLVMGLINSGDGKHEPGIILDFRNMLKASIRQSIQKSGV